MVITSIMVTHTVKTNRFNYNHYLKLNYFMKPNKNVDMLFFYLKTKCVRKIICFV